MVDRIQLVTDRIQFFYVRTQLVTDRIQFFYDRTQLVTDRIQFFYDRIQLEAFRIQIFYIRIQNDRMITNYWQTNAFYPYPSRVYDQSKGSVETFEEFVVILYSSAV